MLYNRSASFRGGDLGVGGRHGRHHLTSLASRPLAEVVERHVPGHHRRDPGAEVASHRGQRVRGVHNGAVQDGRAWHLIIDASSIVEPGEDRRDRDRMGDVRIAAPAQLAPVAPGRDLAGPFDQLSISTWPPSYELRDQAAAQRRHRTVHHDPPGQQLSERDRRHHHLARVRRRLRPSRRCSSRP
jgi:hypothetical protein